MTVTSTDFIVNKSKLSEAKFVETTLPNGSELADGQALLKVDQFALTANNITYAISGDMFHYWDFFPATAKGWGRIPVWGFADVLASTTDGLAVGERLYGYLPISTHLLVQPTRINSRSFMDGVPHRQKGSPIYNQYTITAMDNSYTKEREGAISLFRPLFTTSFLLDDFLADNDFFGARSVVLSSASSKTAIGLAHLLANRNASIKLVGITSAGNVSFVQSLGYYDLVLTYEDVSSLPQEATGFVDFSGNTAVITQLHNHLGDNLKVSSLVGVTHWQAFGRLAKELPGAKPELFFAPAYAQQRIKTWGPVGFQDRMDAVWAGFIPSTESWMSLAHGRGKEAVLNSYQAFLNNQIDPAQGQILSL